MSSPCSVRCWWQDKLEPRLLMTFWRGSNGKLLIVQGAMHCPPSQAWPCLAPATRDANTKHTGAITRARRQSSGIQQAVIVGKSEDLEVCCDRLLILSYPAHRCCPWHTHLRQALCRCSHQASLAPSHGHSAEERAWMDSAGSVLMGEGATSVHTLGWVSPPPRPVAGRSEA